LVTLTDHLERYLGTIAEGWRPPSGTIRALRFANQPKVGVDTFATLGLSDDVLPMKDSRSVRLELIISVYPKYPAGEVASFLMSLAQYVREKRKALLRGDVIRFPWPIVSGAGSSALYCSIPVFFPEPFSCYEGTVPPTVIVWLIPLAGDESNEILRRGWEAFEDTLEKASAVDLWNLERPGILGGHGP